jgi:hypothetical protein
MSSGLEIKASSHKPEWKDQRIWLNLAAIGFESAHMSRKTDIVGDSNDVVGDDDEADTRFFNDDDIFDTKPDPLEKAEAGQAKPIANNVNVAALRNAWLQHMALQEDMKSEREGVQVRNIPGLAGVDYLSPGMLLNYVSYVFGPVIVALKKVGYEEGVDLDAAPYDWRLPFLQLEERDQYCTRTLQQIETMVQKNAKKVVLVCHSMGCLVGHFLLKYAKNTKGQEWIDEHIDTYVPVGGPHLGAPKALRSFITGDKMGLETFLSDSEALLMGRSLGSGLLLLPQQLPSKAPPCAMIRLDGAVQILLKGSVSTIPFLENRLEGSKPSHLQLAITFNGKTIRTSNAKIDSHGKVHFNEPFHFRLDDLPSRNGHKVHVLLLEPGLRFNRRDNSAVRRCCVNSRNCFFAPWTFSSKKHGDDDNEEEDVVETRCCCPVLKNKWANGALQSFNILACWWIWYPISRYVIEYAFKLYFALVYFSFWVIFQVPVITTDEMLKASGGMSVLSMASFVVQEPSDENELDSYYDAELELQRSWTQVLCCGPKRSTSIALHCQWIPRQNAAVETSMAHDYPKVFCQSSSSMSGFHKTIQSRDKRSNAVPYASISGDGLLASEGLDRIMKISQAVLQEGSKFYPSTNSLDTPPIAKIKAIYGVNLPTEVGAIYKRNRAMFATSTQVRNKWALDDKAVLEKAEGFSLKNGILWEKPHGEYPSGDGTVPYWSLSHAKTWSSENSQVLIDEIPNAEHREILNDSRFHKILIDYCAE